MSDGPAAGCSGRVGGLDRARRIAIDELGHRLRTPLTLVVGPVEMLLANEDTPEPMRQQLEVVLEQATALCGDVEQLLDVAVWPAELSPVDADVGALVRRLVDERAADADARGIELSATVTICIARIDVDRIAWALALALSTVLDRAVSGDRVEVSTRCESPRAITVDVAGHPRRPLTVDDGARAIEWSLARAVLAEHGADLVADADSSAIRIDLPADTAADKTAAHPSNRAPMSTVGHSAVAAGTDQSVADRRSILIVEDDDDMRSFLERALSPDYSIVAVSNAEAALSAAQQEPPDLVVCDLVLPGASGEDLIHQLHQDPDLNGIPVIVVTGRTSLHLCERLLRDGAADYVTKPFRIGEVRARIANLLAGSLNIEDLRAKASAAQTLANQLAHALQSRIVIEQAKAFVAAERSITLDDAFEILRTEARSNQRKLRDVAKAVVTEHSA